MKHSLSLCLILAITASNAAAQQAVEPAAPEEEIIEIIQTPTPVDPVTPETAIPEVESVSPQPETPVSSAEVPATVPESIAPEESKPVAAETKPAPSEPKPEEPKKPAGPRRLKFPAVDNVLLDPPLPAHPHGSIPQSSGDTTGDVYIAHRSVVEKYNGWGWVKHESESWNKAQWVAVREQLGKVILPGRHLKHPDSDAEMQYRFYGQFSPETAYEPNKDVFIAVFDLKGFEVIGRASKPSGATLPKKATGSTRSKPTTGGARSNPFRR